MAGKIFVQIAAYRDTQLNATIQDCLAQARYPEQLTFGIAWQWDQQECLDEFLRDPRFRVICIPHQHARGPCWARHLAQHLYAGEEYTIQLDSHHRFAKHWDQTCIEMLEGLREAGFKKPILTAYAPAFDPCNDPAGRGIAPLKLVFHQFAHEGPVCVRPEEIENYQYLNSPIPARFFSAHFAFTLGIFCVEVPYDPYLYFLGEEISLAARAYTHGYDLFHPHQIVIWHEYTRQYKPRHWDDHAEWYVLNENSYARVRVLFGMDDVKTVIEFGEYGFGIVRTLGDYEKYAGLSFKLRGVDYYALNKGRPPTPYQYASEEQWLQSLTREHRFTIWLEDHELPHGVADYDFWVVAAHNKDGAEMFREDLVGVAIDQFIQSIPRQRTYIVYTPEQLASWTVWPHSKTQGWLNRITKPIDHIPA